MWLGVYEVVTKDVRLYLLRKYQFANINVPIHNTMALSSEHPCLLSQWRHPVDVFESFITITEHLVAARLRIILN